MSIKAMVQKYRTRVQSTCMGGERVPPHSVDYWQNQLFTNTMQIILPLSLITTVPGVTYSLMSGYPVIAVLDFLSFGLVIFIALGKGISIQTRKFLLIAVTFVVGTYLLVYIGFKGPGFLFLYSACVFALLILPGRYAYLWSWINVGICMLMALVVHFEWSPVAEVNAMDVAEWVAISVNLIFLCFLSSMLMPQLFDGISETFIRQQKLEDELRAQHNEQQNTLQQLEAKNTEMEQFVYFTSHDLQEPIRMVNSFMGLLEQKYGDKLDEKGQQYVHYATDGGKRMQQIINDLLEFSRLGNPSDQQETVSLNHAVDQVLRMLQEPITQSGAKVEVGSLPVVQSFPSYLEKILINLVSNAVKYSREDVPLKVIIKATEQSDHWQVSIADNGIGIDQEDLDKIFIIFHRLKIRSTVSGSGIGLAIVKKSVEAMGGKIWVASEVGKGSTFYFTIPKTPNLINYGLKEHY